MKRIRLERCAAQIQPPRNPRIPSNPSPFSSETRPAAAPRKQWQTQQQRQYRMQHHWQDQRRQVGGRRKASSAVAVTEAGTGDGEIQNSKQPLVPVGDVAPLKAPSHLRALNSAKLSALHARLDLPSKLPLQTLARCLIDKSVDPRPGYNNAPLATLGQDLLSYYTAEWLLCRYPRLPMPVLFAAQFAYAGDQTLAAMRSEWGVETVAAPGREVDAGLLQLARVTPGNSMAPDDMHRVKDLPSAQRTQQDYARKYRRGMSSRIVYGDEFGDPQHDPAPYPGAPISTPDASSAASSAAATKTGAGETVVAASASFIRALTGALHLHAGAAASKAFHNAHVLSRHLALHTLFDFTHPTRDLSRLCLREGLEPPVARLMSETGRLSRAPVFVIGVYSGEEKLGEGAGSSLDEGRVRAAAAALRSWYLYSPVEEQVMLPSEVEAGGGHRRWKPQMVDIGEIVT